MPRIRQLHAQIEKRMGATMDLPDVKNPAILGYWVVQRNDRVVQFFYIERCLEICFGGADPQAMELVRRFQHEAVQIMLASKARVLHCHVPPQFTAPQQHLKETHFDATGYQHWMLGLVPTEAR